MTTYREAIYMCLDLLKGNSDDFNYTEEHIAYLLDKYRALILKQRYGTDPKKHVPYSNYQTIIVKFDNLTTDMNGYYLSDNQIPYMLQIGIPRVSFEDYYNYKFEFTSRERLPFVGNNKFLKSIWYGAINEENRVCMKASSTVLIVDDEGEPLRLKLTGIFENPREVEDESSFNEGTDELDRNIPIEESLITTLIETVVKVLSNSMYKPEDIANNNHDDLSAVAAATRPDKQK